MEVTYQLERKDYWAYHQFTAKRFAFYKRFNFFPVIVLSALIGFDHWRPATRSGPLSAIIFAVMFSVFLLVTMLWRQKEVLLKATESRPGSIGLHTVLLHSEGFDVHSAVIETRVRWAKVTELRQNETLIVLSLTPRFGFFIPKRAFPTPEQAQLFLETAQAYRQSAIDGTTPVLPSIPQSWPPAPSRITQGKL